MAGDPPTNSFFTVNEITNTNITLNILDPDNFQINDLIIDAAFAPDGTQVERVDNLVVISNLYPSRFYAIQYKGFSQFAEASAILETGANPLPPNDEGLSDGARIGIIFGSLFGLFLLL